MCSLPSTKLPYRAGQKSHLPLNPSQCNWSADNFLSSLHLSWFKRFHLTHDSGISWGHVNSMAGQPSIIQTWLSFKLESWLNPNSTQPWNYYALNSCPHLGVVNADGPGHDWTRRACHWWTGQLAMMSRRRVTWRDWKPFQSRLEVLITFLDLLGCGHPLAGW